MTAKTKTAAKKPAKKSRSVRLDTRTIAHDKLHPNPWNPNKMSERAFEAERESIGRFGFIDPITVRPHPELEDNFQIIDGEHRWRASRDIGMDAVPIVVLDVTDVEAKKLTIVLNETRGQADTVDLAGLLADIKVDDPNLLEALPYTQDQLDNLVALADLDVPDFDPGGDDGGSGGGSDDEWHRLELKVPEAVKLLFEQTVDRVQSDGAAQHADPAIAAGMVLEILCAEYAAG